jgi:transcription elongation factor GreA
MLADEDSEDEIEYRIVGSHEADIKNGRLPVTSPLARALVGKHIGDTVEVTTPGGHKSYEIVDVRYN